MTSGPIKPTSFIRDADLHLRIAGLPVYRTLEAEKQSLGDPPAVLCRFQRAPAAWRVHRQLNCCRCFEYFYTMIYRRQTNVGGILIVIVVGYRGARRDYEVAGAVVEVIEEIDGAATDLRDLSELVQHVILLPENVDIRL